MCLKYLKMQWRPVSMRLVHMINFSLFFFAKLLSGTRTVCKPASNCPRVLSICTTIGCSIRNFKCPIFCFQFLFNFTLVTNECTKVRIMKNIEILEKLYLQQPLTNSSLLILWMLLRGKPVDTSDENALVMACRSYPILPCRSPVHII